MEVPLVLVRVAVAAGWLFAGPGRAIWAKVNPPGSPAICSKLPQRGFRVGACRWSLLQRGGSLPFCPFSICDGRDRFRRCV